MNHSYREFKLCVFNLNNELYERKKSENDMRDFAVFQTQNKSLYLVFLFSKRNTIFVLFGKVL